MDGDDAPLPFDPAPRGVLVGSRVVGMASSSRNETVTCSSWLVRVQRKEMLREVKGGSGGQ